MRVYVKMLTREIWIRSRRLGSDNHDDGYVVCYNKIRILL